LRLPKNQRKNIQRSTSNLQRSLKIQYSNFARMTRFRKHLKGLRSPALSSSPERIRGAGGEGANKAPLILGVGLALCSKGEIKGGTLADGSFGPDRAAVTAHNAFHRRQADACAFEVLGPMQSLKNAE